MNILLASSYFLHPSCNGASQLTRRMAGALQGAGHQVFVTCADDKAEPGRLERKMQDGIEVLAVCPPEKAGDRRPLAAMRPNAARKALFHQLLDQIKPDILHLTASGGFLPLAEAAQEMKVPVIATLLDFGLLCPTHFLLDYRGAQCDGAPSVHKCWRCVQQGASVPRKLLNTIGRFQLGRWLAAGILGKSKSYEFHLRDALNEGLGYLERIRSLVACFIAPAPIARRIVERHGVPAERIVDLVYSLPAEKLVPAPRASGLPVLDRPLRVGYAGRVCAEKGIAVLVDAFRALGPMAPCELRVLGRGANLKNLAALCPKAPDLADLVQTAHIRLFDDLGEDAMRNEMAQLDVGVVPSICHECTPLTLLELLAQGVPCIVSDSDGIRHLVSDGVNGRVFPVGDARALALSTQDILARPAVLEQWRQHLYQPASDARYAASLSALYLRLTRL